MIQNMMKPRLASIDINRVVAGLAIITASGAEPTGAVLVDTVKTPKALSIFIKSLVDIAPNMRHANLQAMKRETHYG